MLRSILASPSAQSARREDKPIKCSTRLTRCAPAPTLASVSATRPHGSTPEPHFPQPSISSVNWNGRQERGDERYASQLDRSAQEHFEESVAAVRAGLTAVSAQVTNFGNGPGRGVHGQILSVGGRSIGPGDALIDHSSVALGAGQTKTMEFSFVKSGTLSGEYLITANPGNEADTSNNVAVG